jgi:hypothetical protein
MMRMEDNEPFCLLSRGRRQPPYADLKRWTSVKIHNKSNDIEKKRNAEIAFFASCFSP